MVLSEEDVAALRSSLERVQKEKEAAEAKTREYEAKLERLRRERSLGTSFDGQGGGNSADRRGTAASTMGPMWTRGVSTGGGLGQGLPYVPRDIVPKFPVECPPYVYIAWERRFEVFIANQGLRHTISPDAPEIAVISCINGAYLFGHFGEALNHRPQTGMRVHFRSDCWFSLRGSSVRVSLRFGCFEDNEGVVVTPLPSRAAFACGGAGGNSIHGGRRPQICLCPHFPSRDNDASCRHREKLIRNCSDTSPPAPGTLRCHENNDFDRPPTDPPETRKYHPFRLLSPQGP